MSITPYPLREIKLYFSLEHNNKQFNSDKVANSLLEGIDSLFESLLFELCIFIFDFDTALSALLHPIIQVEHWGPHMTKNLTIALGLLLSLVVPLNFLAVAAAADSRVIEEKIAKYEYLNHLYQVSHILRVAGGQLISTSDKLPRDTEEAHELFEKVCAPKTSNADLNRKLTITYNNFLITNEFHCDARSEDSGNVETIQFVATINRDEVLKDLQINQLSANYSSALEENRTLDLKEGAEVAIAVAASTLVAGIMAKQIYNGEQDKFLHATTGSLIAAGATLISYYGFKLTKNQAALVGFATAVAAALFKEYAYDARNRNNHTVDSRDAAATAMGGGLGALFLRLKFKF